MFQSKFSPELATTMTCKLLRLFIKKIQTILDSDNIWMLLMTYKPHLNQQNYSKISKHYYLNIDSEYIRLTILYNT